MTKTVVSGTNYDNYTLSPGGYISGTISKATPGGVWSDIIIEVFDDSMIPMAWGHAEDPDGGIYNTYAVPPGTYYVRFEDKSALYATKWYEDIPDWESQNATPVVVSLNSVASGKDVSLEEAGAISGMINDLNSDPLLGVVIGVNVRSGDPCGEHHHVASTDLDTENGTYTVNGIPPGTYYLNAWDNNTAYIGEWWTGAAGDPSNRDCSLAQTIVVVAGATETNKNFQLEQAGTISGTVYEADEETPIGGLHLYAIDSTTEDWINGVNTETDGSYSLSLPEGDYKIKACPDCDGYSFTFAPEYFDDTPYRSLASVVSVTAGQDTSDIDFLLEQGGNISGTVTTDPAGANLDNIQVIVKNEDGEWIISGSVNPDGSYSTNYVAAGNYIVEFRDNGDQFQGEYYDQVPTWSRSTATQVSVSSGATTPDIDVTLKELTIDRYYPQNSWVYTYHTYDNSRMTTVTASWAEVRVGLFIDNTSSKRVTINSDLEVTKPSGTCSDNSSFAGNIWRLRVYDDDPNDGAIEDNEMDWPQILTNYVKTCDFGNTPHDAGNYTFNITLPDNSVISTTMTNVAGARSQENFPPVTNLSAGWNTDDDTMTVSWIPSGYSYPDGTFVEVRLYLYSNGHYINNQIRVTKLPIEITSFTFRPDMTIYFDTGKVDQIFVDVRVIEQNWATVTRSRQAYTFDWLTKNLTPAPIKMTLLDVDGDRQTGLAEAIYSLQAVSGN